MGKEAAKDGGCRRLPGQCLERNEGRRDVSKRLLSPGLPGHCKDREGVSFWIPDVEQGEGELIVV